MNMNKLQFARLGKGLRAIKIVKVLRLLRYASQSRTMIEQCAQQGWTDAFKSNTFKIVKYYVYIFMVCHYLACIQYGIAFFYYSNFDDIPDNCWVKKDIRYLEENLIKTGSTTHEFEPI